MIMRRHFGRSTGYSRGYRSGGIYVLEDWGWAHWGGWQNPEDESFARPAMSNVVLHTALSCTSSSGTIISHIDVTPCQRTSTAARRSSALSSLSSLRI